MQNHQHHILIVDDDEKILDLLGQYLQKHGYLVSLLSNPGLVSAYIEYFQFDLVILDVMMPEITGFELASRLRQKKHHIPIVMLSALSEAKNKIEGLEYGASDYITKPFDPKELILRIGNLISLHRNYRLAENDFIFGTLRYNPHKKELKNNDKIIKINHSETQLLEYFMNNIGVEVSRSKLAKQLELENDRSVDVQIMRLRAKIEPDLKQPVHLKTVRNKGYVFHQ